MLCTLTDTRYCNGDKLILHFRLIETVEEELLSKDKKKELLGELKRYYGILTSDETRDFSASDHEAESMDGTLFIDLFLFPQCFLMTRTADM